MWTSPTAKSDSPNLAWAVAVLQLLSLHGDSWHEVRVSRSALLAIAISSVAMGRGVVLVEAASGTNQIVLTRDNFLYADARSVASAFNQHISSLRSMHHDV